MSDWAIRAALAALAFAAIRAEIRTYFLSKEMDLVYGILESLDGENEASLTILRSVVGRRNA